MSGKALKAKEREALLSSKTKNKRTMFICRPCVKLGPRSGFECPNDKSSELTLMVDLMKKDIKKNYEMKVTSLKR